MMNNNVRAQKKLNWKWSLVTIIVSGSLLYFIQLFYLHGVVEESNRQAIRISARIAVVLFSMAFVASALHRLTRNSFTWWMRMNRRYLGISFAILHLIHLGFLLMLQQKFHPVFYMAKMISLLGGGLAYVFVILMLLTSFPRFSKYLSPKNWTFLHTVGGYWIWYIFMRTYVKRAMTASEYLPIVVMLMMVLVIRLWGLRAKKRLDAPKNMKH
jgi:hypothetical protein